MIDGIPNSPRFLDPQWNHILNRAQRQKGGAQLGGANAPEPSNADESDPRNLSQPIQILRDWGSEERRQRKHREAPKLWSQIEDRLKETP